MRLYHFTAGENLRGIAQYGLTVGDVPTDIQRGRGRIGVWFTDSSGFDGHGLEGSAVDKTRFRLTVDVPQTGLLVQWVEWAPSNVTPDTCDALRSAVVDGDYAEETWFVFFGVVKPELIVSVTDMRTGEELADWREAWPESESRKGIAPFRREAWQKNMLKGVRRVVREHQRVA